MKKAAMYVGFGCHGVTSTRTTVQVKRVGFRVSDVSCPTTARWWWGCTCHEDSAARFLNSIGEDTPVNPRRLSLGAAHPAGPTQNSSHTRMAGSD